MLKLQDNDEDEFQTLYNNGHWEWSNADDKLIFISDEPSIEEDFEILTPAAFKHGRVEFRDDIDLIEQQAYRKRYQRKDCGENDVILLQDVKDLAIYTAPTSILNLNILRILHLPSTERFIRALIFYCQYYIQTSEIMSNRLLEAETKVRTTRSLDVELELRDNLEDLRLLVAKEYCTFLLGCKEYNKFHHMGPHRKSKSLSKKEAFIFESFVSICVQIIWLALGRRAYDQIELEVHRLFKSQKYNIVEHRRRRTNNTSKMSPEEKFVLLGHCLQNKTKLYIKSPLLNEATCDRPMDFRLFGLGNVKYSCLTYRQMYLEKALTANETTFKAKGLSLGILGLPRSRFDTMLMEIKRGTTASSGVIASSRSLTQSSSIRKSRTTESSASAFLKPYDDIVLPEKTFDKEWMPNSFPTETTPCTPCDLVQRGKWINRHIQLNKKRYQTRIRK